MLVWCKESSQFPLLWIWKGFRKYNFFLKKYLLCVFPSSFQKNVPCHCPSAKTEYSLSPVFCLWPLVHLWPVVRLHHPIFWAARSHFLSFLFFSMWVVPCGLLAHFNSARIFFSFSDHNWTSTLSFVYIKNKSYKSHLEIFLQRLTLMLYLKSLSLYNKHKKCTFGFHTFVHFSICRHFMFIYRCEVGSLLSLPPVWLPV